MQGPFDVSYGLWMASGNEQILYVSVEILCVMDGLRVQCVCLLGPHYDHISRF